MLTKRAEQWAIKKLQEHRNYSSMSDRMRKVWMDAYTQDYVSIATEQKAIDDAELAKLKKAWEKEAEVNHDAKKAYAQGYHDALEKAYEWIINTYLGDYVTDEFGNGGIGDNVKLANDLRKAMEE